MIIFSFFKKLNILSLTGLHSRKRERGEGKGEERGGMGGLQCLFSKFHMISCQAGGCEFENNLYKEVLFLCHVKSSQL